MLARLAARRRSGPAIVLWAPYCCCYRSKAPPTLNGLSPSNGSEPARLAAARARLARLSAASLEGDAGSLAPVRLTMFWDRMRAQFGDTYAESVAKDHVLTVLGGRTVNQALAEGEDAKTVWRAVCETFDLPDRAR